MQLVSEVLKKSIPQKTAMVEYLAVVGGWRKLREPTQSNTLRCAICDGSEHYTTLLDPSKGPEKAWICAKLNCEATTQFLPSRATTTPLKPKRTLEWPLFCELCGVGDVHHTTTFDYVESGIKGPMMDFLLKDKPFLMMKGDKGTGKTYSALGLCEFYTRLNSSCYFTTQKKMVADWLDTFKSDRMSNYIDKISKIELLVVDDFGTGNLAPGFMSFFMDLMNSRMQWKKRKTVITTNLESEELTDICGDALTDRLRTGMVLSFRGESKRQ